jgi:hypothetical protein
MQCTYANNCAPACSAEAARAGAACVLSAKSAHTDTIAPRRALPRQRALAQPACCRAKVHPQKQVRSGVLCRGSALWRSLRVVAQKCTYFPAACSAKPARAGAASAREVGRWQKWADGNKCAPVCSDQLRRTHAHGSSRSDELRNSSPVSPKNILMLAAPEGACISVRGGHCDVARLVGEEAAARRVRR